MKLVYIAGPYRASDPWFIEQNIRKAEELCLAVWKRGHVGICVHSMCRFMYNSAPDEVWIKGDLELLHRCDSMLLVEGWENSEGTLGEIEYCKEHGIPFYTDLQECIGVMNTLDRWRKK